MTPLGILTLIVSGLALAMIAVFLIRYLVALRRVAGVLGTVAGAVRGISRQVEPLQPLLSNVNGNLAAAHNTLAGVLGR